MALIECPECSKRISDKAEMCPNCGLPSTFFFAKNLNKSKTDAKQTLDCGVDFTNIINVLIAFDEDYHAIFHRNCYISSSESRSLIDTYSSYFNSLSNDLIINHIKNNASDLRIDMSLLNSFISRFRQLDTSIEVYRGSCHANICFLFGK